MVFRPSRSGAATRNPSDEHFGNHDVGPHYGPGTIKVYALGATERSPALPKVPTTKEVGLPNLDASPWWALFAPKGTPQPILDKLAQETAKALSDPEVKAKADAAGLFPATSTPAQFAAFIRSEAARWQHPFLFLKCSSLVVRFHRELRNANCGVRAAS